MPHQLSKLTPNLVVSDVARSIAFYRDRIGLQLQTTEPASPPYVFAIMRSGSVEIFLNAPEPAAAEYPALKGRPLGGTFTMFIEVQEIESSYAELQHQVPIVMPLEHKWYGMTEFAFTDPDGYIITLAERTPSK